MRHREVPPLTKKDKAFYIIGFLIIIILGLSGVECDEKWNCKEDLGAWELNNE